VAEKVCAPTANVTVTAVTGDDSAAPIRKFPTVSASQVPRCVTGDAPEVVNVAIDVFVITPSAREPTEYCTRGHPSVLRGTRGPGRGCVQAAPGVRRRRGRLRGGEHPGNRVVLRQGGCERHRLRPFARFSMRLPTSACCALACPAFLVGHVVAGLVVGHRQLHRMRTPHPVLVLNGIGHGHSGGLVVEVQEVRGHIEEVPVDARVRGRDAARDRTGVCQESWTDPRLLIMQRLLRSGTR
jgi:hypothetical protein